MYILSQNKERLVKVSSLFIEKNGDKWEIDNDGDWLGTYETKTYLKVWSGVMQHLKCHKMKK